VPAFVRDLVQSFKQLRLLPSAAAVSFNAVWSLPPLAVLLLALAGYLDLTGAWKDHLGPQVEKRVTPQAWAAIDSTVNKILGAPHFTWVVVGAVLATWHVSGLVRASTGALNAIFEEQESRGGFEQIWKSVAAAIPVVILACLALLIAIGGRLISADGFAGAVLFVARWAVAAVVLWALLAIIIRVAPSARPHARWVSLGAALAVGGWIAASIAFGIYIGYIANFRSAYGNLISVMLLLAYVYTLSVIFLAGVVVDTTIAKRT